MNLAQAFLLGKLEGLSEEQFFLLGRTGLLHLFSASGFHLQASLFFFALLFRLWPKTDRSLTSIKHKKILQSFLVFLFLLFFAWRTGFSGPMLRAFTSASILLYCHAKGLKASLWQAFGLSASVALLGNSSFLSWSFSVTSMMGILLAGNSLWRQQIYPWLLSYPLGLAAFSLGSAFAPFYNLALGQAFALLAFPPAFLALLSESLGFPHMAHFLYSTSHTILDWLLVVLAQLETLGTNYFFPGVFWSPLLPTCLYSIFILALFRFMNLSFTRKEGKFAWACLAFLSFTLAPLLRPQAVFLSVGQGDAFFLAQNASKKMIDLGPPAWKKPYPAPAVSALEKLGVNTLDKVFLTHADKDHVGGLGSLLLRHKVNEVYVTHATLREKKFLPSLALLEANGVRLRLWEKNHDFSCHFFPNSRSSNESSPYCHIVLNSGASLALTGDQSQKGEHYFLEQGLVQKVDYFKLGHHGSKSSSSENFLAALGAHTYIVSAARKNRYRHPHQEVLDRLKNKRVIHLGQTGNYVLE